MDTKAEYKQRSKLIIDNWGVAGVVVLRKCAII